MSFHPNKPRLLWLGAHLGADMLCLGCELDGGGGGLLGSEGVVDQMTMSAPQDLGLKGDRTVFGLHHAGSAVLFK